MRGLSALKTLLIANLIWTTLVFYMCGIINRNNLCDDDRRERLKEVKSETSWEEKDLAIVALKRIVQSKCPNVESLIRPYIDEKLPVIYAVTPTYSRWTQKADLTRLCQTFLHVPNFYWIIVEDAEVKSDLVARLLKNCGLPYAHLAMKTVDDYKMKDTDPSWLKPRGVSQRNKGLEWIRTNVKRDASGVLYFVDDDNTYSLTLFEEMRFTRTVSVWPVGIVGGLKFEGPLCKNGKVTSWYTAWKPERPFPIDMAGFAVNISLVLHNPDANFSNRVQRGYQESHFLSKIVTKEKLEARANDCSEILVWHTRTEKPNMKQELKLERIGKASDPKMEV